MQGKVYFSPKHCSRSAVVLYGIARVEKQDLSYSVQQPTEPKKIVRDCLGHSEKDTDYPESLIHVFGRVRHERPYFGSAEKKNAQSLNRNSRVRHEVIWAEPQLEMDYTSKTWLHLCGVWSLNMEQQFVTILMGLSARACIYEVSLEMLSIWLNLVFCSELTNHLPN